MRKRLEALLAEYGKLALVIYFVLFGLVFAGAYVALSFGFAFEGTAASAGRLGAAYVAAQITKPVRIGLTLVLTPLVARLWRRRS